MEFFRASNIHPALRVCLFWLKVAAGVMVTCFYLREDPQADVAVNFRIGAEETDLLLQNPGEYFRNFFAAGYDSGYSGFFATKNSYWNNLSANVSIKLISLLNFLSFKYLYVNVLLFNFLTFFAPVALYRVFCHWAKAPARIFLVLFLLPSTLLYPSAVHKEGLLFLAVAMLVYHVYFMLHHEFSRKRGVAILFFALLLMALRNSVFLLFIPGVFCWLIGGSGRQKALRVFAVVYAAIFFVVLFSAYLLDFNLLEILTNRRLAIEHISEHAKSHLHPAPLEATWFDFLKHFPQAVFNAFFRPHLFEYPSVPYLPFKVEVLLLEILLLVFLWQGGKGIEKTAFLWFLVFFCFTNILVIGYTIPVLGPIVRYRSVFLVLLFGLLLSQFSPRSAEYKLDKKI